MFIIKKKSNNSYRNMNVIEKVNYFFDISKDEWRVEDENITYFHAIRLNNTIIIKEWYMLSNEIFYDFLMEINSDIIVYKYVIEKYQRYKKFLSNFCYIKDYNDDYVTLNKDTKDLNLYIFDNHVKEYGTDLNKLPNRYNKEKFIDYCFHITLITK
jgi:hypothetical protein